MSDRHNRTQRNALPVRWVGWCAAAGIAIITVAIMALHVHGLAWPMLAWAAALAVSGSLLIARESTRLAASADLAGRLAAATEAARAGRRDLDVVVRDRQRVEQELSGAKEAAELALKTRSEFMANMSHEIRTPMNGVLGMTELLLGTELNRKQRHFADTIHRCGEQLLALINDVLDLSKIEAGRLQLDETDFDLRRLIEDVNDMFAEQAHRKNVDLNCVCAPALDTAVRGDVYRVKQVLVNLIGNAVKFTAQGEVVTRVGLVGQDGAKIDLRIEVSDTGIGIRTDALSRLFIAFSQADSSTTREYGGTGLGLAICKKLVQIMGGEIGVKSDFGRGSTFWFTLGFGRAKSQSDNGTGDAPALDGAHVLIADARDSSRTALVRQLHAWGVTAMAVSDGDAALTALGEAHRAGRSFDAAILDQATMGPRVGGVVRDLKAAPGHANVRIIMLTSIVSMESTGQWLAVGVDGYVEKPVRQRELLQYLLRVLGRSDRQPISTVAIDAQSGSYNAHVLVAEDNPVNQELIIAVLEQFGCRAQVVNNGREVVEALTSRPLDTARDPYDMILMDCQMPLLDGYAATDAIRQWEKSEQHDVRLPIVALTANSMEGDRERCLAAGMDDYLAKPLRRAHLAEALNRWLPARKEISSPNAVASAVPAQAPGSANTTALHHALDMEVVERIRALQRPGQPDLLARVVAVYLEKSPELIVGIHEAVAARDAQRLLERAHSLKSSSANLGALKVAELSRELEHSARNGDLEKAQTRYDMLQYEFQLARAALKALVSKQAA